MALRVNTDEYLEKWARRTSGASQDYRSGIERVTEAPGIKAAQAADAMRAGLLESLDSGKWQRNVAAVSLQDWKETTIEKGVSRLGPGVQASIGRNRAKIDKLLADVESSKNEVDRMPSATFQDRVQKMVQFSTLMHNKALAG